MANTNILIKRSTTTGRPGSLLAGEFAYSYSSNTLYIGSPSGTGVVNVGGQFYTSTIDAATAANTAGTLVRRDTNGNFAGRLTGIADKADQLTNARNFSISGTDITATAQSFDGSAAITLNAALNAVPGLSAGSYGSTTEIPVLNIGANGRILGVSTAGITTAFTVAADSGSPQTISGGDTLTLIGAAGITSSIGTGGPDSVEFSVDNTVVRANTPITLQTIDGAVEISGNLTVLGTQFITNTTTLNIADPLIYLASNNYVSDIVDIGYVGNYYDGSSQRHAGVFRHAGTKEFYVFDNYGLEPDNNVIDVADASFRAANVNANYFKGNVIATTANVTAATIITANVTGNLGVSGNTYFTGYVLADGNKGYTFGSQTSSQIRGSGGYLRFYQDNQQKFLINNTGPYSLATHQFKDGSAIDPSVTSGSWPSTAGLYFPTVGVLGLTGIAKVTNTDDAANTTSGALQVSGGVGIAGNTYIGGTLNVTGVTSLGTLSLTSALTVPNGGTGANTFSSGGLLIGNGTNAIGTLANTTFVATNSTTVDGGINRLGGVGKTITSVSVDEYGRFKALTYTDISGLQLYQGGTGVSSFTTNGVTYGNGTSAMGVTAAAGTSDQDWSNQILTTTNAGVPVWTTALDGGQF